MSELGGRVPGGVAEELQVARRGGNCAREHGLFELEGMRLTEGVFDAALFGEHLAAPLEQEPH
jgi:hypothetical protein